jgi:hypothetical protein
MNKEQVTRSHSIHWNRAFSVLLTVALLMALLVMATACSFDGPEREGAGYLDINGAVHGTTTESVSNGIRANQLLRTGNDPVALCSVNWN